MVTDCFWLATSLKSADSWSIKTTRRVPRSLLFTRNSASIGFYLNSSEMFKYFWTRSLPSNFKLQNRIEVFWQLLIKVQNRKLFAFDDKIYKVWYNNVKLDWKLCERLSFDQDDCQLFKTNAPTQKRVNYKISVWNKRIYYWIDNINRIQCRFISVLFFIVNAFSVHKLLLQTENYFLAIRVLPLAVRLLEALVDAPLALGRVPGVAADAVRVRVRVAVLAPHKADRQQGQTKTYYSGLHCVFLQIWKNQT